MIILYEHNLAIIDSLTTLEGTQLRQERFVTCLCFCAGLLTGKTITSPIRAIVHVATC